MSAFWTGFEKRAKEDLSQKGDSELERIGRREESSKKTRATVGGIAGHELGNLLGSKIDVRAGRRAAGGAKSFPIGRTGSNIGRLLGGAVGLAAGYHSGTLRDQHIDRANDELKRRAEAKKNG